MVIYKMDFECSCPPEVQIWTPIMGGMHHGLPMIRSYDYYVQ